MKLDECVELHFRSKNNESGDWMTLMSLGSELRIRVSSNIRIPRKTVTRVVEELNEWLELTKGMQEQQEKITS